MKLIKCRTIGIQQFVEESFFNLLNLSEDKKYPFFEFNQIMKAYSEWKELDSVDLTY